MRPRTTGDIVVPPDREDFRDREAFPVLTGLRGLAALWVLVYHCWVLAGPRRIELELAGLVLDFTPFFSLGWAGVQIFFVLSGFLLAQPFVAWHLGQRDKPDVRHFLLRRIARVFPAYYLQLILLIAIAQFVEQRDVLGTMGALGLLQHLLMLFVPPPLGVQALNGVWWTLPIEFSFYLALPVLALWLRPGRAGWMMAILFGLMLGWRYAAVTVLGDQPIPARLLLSYQLPGVMDSFGLGMLAALLHMKDPVGRLSDFWGRLRKWRLQAALFLLVAMLYWMHADFERYWSVSPIFFLWTPLFSLAVMLLVLEAATGNSLLNKVLANQAMQWLGMISYGVYLWHLPLLEALATTRWIEGHDGYRFPPLLAGTLLATIIVAWCSWVLVERHAIAWARGRSASKVINETNSMTERSRV